MRVIWTSWLKECQQQTSLKLYGQWTDYQTIKQLTQYSTSSGDIDDVINGNGVDDDVDEDDDLTHDNGVDDDVDGVVNQVIS